ncbi:hemerythrin domain-containing protein [Microbacterium sp. NPDC079995]|uniref:hemerythrin domain-containing protein n=1 Tax=unclassified Microbacterium TaxID=2609290 RepID=UPI00344B6224
MATALPATGATPSAVRCDTSDMLLVHRLLRSLYVGAGCLVRTVGDDQPQRRRNVSAHIAMIAGMLHHHHHTEDTLLWDDLAERAPACGLHVDAMRRQHAAMAVLLTDLNAGIDAWDARGGADDGTVSGLLERIRLTLDAHLGQEEELILPFAERVFSQTEWNRLGEMGSAHTPKDLMFIQLGYLIASLPEDRAAHWVASNLPLPARVLWACIGRRQYARYRRGLAVAA